MGGSLRAIFLTSEAREAAASVPASQFKWGPVVMPALLTLQRSTAARKGHRTVMDALILMVEELRAIEDFTGLHQCCSCCRGRG